MDRRQEMAALQRIVALLLALADLADLARESSPAVRFLVLWFLRPAELVARDFVFGAPSPAGFEPDRAAEAMRLAQDFRALARALQRRFGAGPIASGRALRAFAVALAQSLAPAREKKLAPHDTS
jgi:hypothetical protein